MALEMKYFVLKPRSKRASDPWAAASRRAMRAFAASIRKTDPDLADRLNAWTDLERARDAAPLETVAELRKATKVERRG